MTRLTFSLKERTSVRHKQRLFLFAAKNEKKNQEQ